MIHATELRIGNVLLQEGSVVFVTHRIISDIASAPEHHNYQPILITEEWLKRLGFEYFTNGWHEIKMPCGSKKLSVSIEQAGFTIGDDDYNDEVTFPNLDFVHQLQNLYFSLTFEELKTNKLRY